MTRMQTVPRGLLVLLLVDGEPWNAIGALREARMVIQGGHIVPRER